MKSHEFPEDFTIRTSVHRVHHSSPTFFGTATVGHATQRLEKMAWRTKKHGLLSHLKRYVKIVLI
jgi:hypothetical protein